MLALETNGLSKRYGERLAVEKLDLHLQAGKVTGFVGPNGAGKTTTLRMLLGLISPTSGSGQVLGEPLSHPERYLSKVGALIEAPAFYPKLSGSQNLRVFARLAGLGEERIAQVIDQVRLTGRDRDRYRTYSLGMKQRLGLAAALLPDPQLLILDEPTNGMDPAGIREMRELLRELADAGRTVFVSSHLLSEIQAICDELVLITKGTVQFQGPVSELLGRREHSELRAIPEHERDLARVAVLAVKDGHPARAEQGVVLIDAPADYAAELNRAAHRAGITLAELHRTSSTLEDVYFSLTGQDEEQVL